MTLHNFASLSRFAGICAVVSLLAAPAAAATISYGDMDDFAGGGVVEYQDIIESSPTSSPLPLYNTPDVVVNQLDFDPTGFGASADSGDLDITDGQLNFDFEALPGTGLRNLVIEEGGDYRFFGGGAATQVSFSLFADIMVTAVDGVALAPADQFNVIGSNGATLNAVANPTPVSNLPWSLGVNIEFGPELSSRGFGPDAVVTAGELVLNNTLIAASETGSIAFIAKKDINFTPGGPLDPDNVIPEPTAALLAILAATGFAARRR